MHFKVLQFLCKGSYLVASTGMVNLHDTYKYTQQTEGKI